MLFRSGCLHIGPGAPSQLELTDRTNSDGIDRGRARLFIRGSGKASLLWSIVRAMLPAMVAGLVRVWAADHTSECEAPFSGLNGKTSPDPGK